MNEIQMFQHPEFGAVRTMTIDNEPWFVGKDVAEVLGYSNTRDALAKHVDEEDKATVAIHDGSQNRNVTVINESGLYSLILSSKLPTAKAFKRWVTNEVLPAIRKHGAYMTPSALEQAINNPDFAIGLLNALKEEQEARQALETKVQVQETRIEEMRPKEIFADAVADDKDCILVGDLAKLLKQNGIDIGQKRLFEWMHKNGYLMNKSSKIKHMPTQRAMDLGVFRAKETALKFPNGKSKTTYTVMVTAKGQQYFINKFLDATYVQEVLEYVE